MGNRMNGIVVKVLRTLDGWFSLPPIPGLDHGCGCTLDHSAEVDTVADDTGVVT